MEIRILRADYADPRHRTEIPALLDAYARDPMGGGKPLSEPVKTGLVAALAALPHAFSLIGYVDGRAAALANCFDGFSTFECKPLVNIHDLVVLPEYRGLGLSLSMLGRVEEIAREKGCVKLTLEVLSGNRVAQAAYRRFGFAGYALTGDTGNALFWQKSLSDPD